LKCEFCLSRVKYVRCHRNDYFYKKHRSFIFKSVLVRFFCGYSDSRRVCLSLCAPTRKFLNFPLRVNILKKYIFFFYQPRKTDCIFFLILARRTRMKFISENCVFNMMQFFKMCVA
jgi:hypothetical protein